MVLNIEQRCPHLEELQAVAHDEWALWEAAGCGDAQDRGAGCDDGKPVPVPAARDDAEEKEGALLELGGFAKIVHGLGDHVDDGDYQG